MTCNVVVLAMGIADPKWPLPSLEIGAEGTALRGAPPTMLGTFDEAALEVALKVRDSHESTHLTFVLIDGSGSEALARTVGGYRPDALVRLDASALPACDAAAMATFMADVVRTLPAPQLVLIGREFGDLDDGAVAPCLVEHLGWPFAALVQEVAFDGQRFELMRERGTVREWSELAPPVLASVTNDRRNRLRHPLLKNVMAAKRAVYPVTRIEGIRASPALTLAAAGRAPAPARTPCRLVEGPLDVQVAALATYLLEARAAP